MLITLTQSDWIALSVGVLQILATILVGLWPSNQHRITRQSEPKPKTESKRHLKRRILAYSWIPSFGLAIYSVFRLTSIYSTNTQLDAEYLHLIVFWSSFFIYNLLLAWISWVVSGLIDTISGISEVQHRILDLQDKTTDVLSGNISEKSNPTRKFKRIKKRRINT